MMSEYNRLILLKYTTKFLTIIHKDSNYVGKFIQTDQREKGE